MVHCNCMLQRDNCLLNLNLHHPYSCLVEGGREGTADFFGLADWSTWTPYARKPRKKLPCCEMAWWYLSGTVIVSVMVSTGVGAFLTWLCETVRLRSSARA